MVDLSQMETKQYESVISTNMFCSGLLWNLLGENIGSRDGPH